MHQPLDDTTAPVRTVYDAANAPPISAPTLSGDTAAAVVVIGGGFVGCSAALHAAELGHEVVLLERQQVGWGSSGRNAGQVSAHASKLEPTAVLKTYGPVHGARLNAAGATAPEFVLDLASRYDFDVHAVRGGILTGAHRPQAMEKLQLRAEYWQSQGAAVELLDQAQTAGIVGSDFYAGSVVDRRGIAINPLSFVRGLAHAARSRGARIFENTEVSRISQRGGGWTVEASGGNIRCDKVLVCTNAYTGNIWPGLKSTVIPVRGYQIWSKPLPDADKSKVLRGISAMLDTRRLLTGMRLHPDGRLQFSGGIGFGPEHVPDIASSLARVRQILPSLGPVEIEGWWSGWVTRGISDGWRLHELAPGIATAIGCNGRGVAMGAIFGRELARFADGVPSDALLIPLTAPKAVPGIGGHGPIAALVQRYYGWQDRKEVKAAQRLRNPARSKKLVP